MHFHDDVLTQTEINSQRVLSAQFKRKLPQIKSDQVYNKRFLPA